jgi:hypothetical protein
VAKHREGTAAGRASVHASSKSDFEAQLPRWGRKWRDRLWNLLGRYEFGATRLTFEADCFDDFGK